MAVLQTYRLGKGRGKKEKRNYYNTGYSYLVTHPSTNVAQQVGVLVVEWLYAERIFLKIRKMRKGIEINIWYCMAGKVENKIFEEYENENYYLVIGQAALSL